VAERDDSAILYSTNIVLFSIVQLSGLSNMPKQGMRIAVGGIAHESNTFTPVWTDYRDFRVARGTRMFEGRLRHLLGIDGIELVPSFGAQTVPGGILRGSAYRDLKDELLNELKAVLPVDGVYLSLHGALEVEGIGDGESDLVSSVRGLVGRDVLVSVSLDLHANVSPELVDQADIVTAFRTAPHRDLAETRERAVRLLARSLREGLRPVSALAKPPVLLAGESAVTDVEPARSLYARLPEIDRIPGVLDSSLLIGCAWTDSPFTSTSVIVIAERDQALAQRHADELARRVWARRREFALDVEAASVDESIRLATAASERPVFISDSGDNVTAGAAGDMPLLAERLVALGATDALVAGLADPAAVRQCAAAGVGAEVQLSIGGKLDRANGKPFAAKARVQHLSSQSADRDGEPDTAVVRVGGASIVLTSDRRPFVDCAGITRAGVDPMTQKIVVVKLGYLFPDLRQRAARAIMALSPGTSDLRLERLPFEHLRRPIFPLDGEFDWEPRPMSA
jgi:microcystin degradation protein MlrC